MSRTWRVIGDLDYTCAPEARLETLQGFGSSSYLWTFSKGQDSRPSVIRGICGGKTCHVEFMASPIGDSQCGPLGFWNKAMPSAAEDCDAFQKAVLDGALIETQCLALR